MPLSLVRNNCDGTWSDVTRAAGLADGLYASQIAVWSDVDKDGRLDLFVGDEQGPSQLFRSRKDGTFENVSHAAGVDRRSFVKGAVAEDYDNDGWPDLFVSNIRGDNLLYHNNGDGTFAEASERAGVRTSYASFTTWFFDYDNDGWPDLFVASDYASVDEMMRTYVGQPNNVGTLKLYRNARNGTFTDVTHAVALDRVYMPMGANFGDVDADGYPDIFLGNGAPDLGSLAPTTLLRNDAGRTFVDITDSSGTGELHKKHGIAFADLENRGRQDIVMSMGGAVPSDAHAIRLFRNPGNGNDWIAVKLVGTKSNRSGMGARIEVTVDRKGHGTRTVYRTVNSGGSFGASPLLQTIGLGPGAKITRVEVVWPDRKTRQVVKSVAAGQGIEIKEGVPGYRPLGLKTYRLRGRAPAGTSVAEGRR